jgi:DNA-binding MarR family transcriptional regulator
MTRVPIHELRRMGVSQEDIDLARATQEAQRRVGAPVQSIAVIVGAVAPRPRGTAPAPNAPVSFTERALRRRGSYDQAALLLDQKALEERNPERALRARELAQGAKELGAAGQIEFDFFGGNVSIAFQYQDAVTERLNAAAPTSAARDRALATLWQIVRNLGWQSYECTKTAADLSDVLGYDKGDMARTLKLLEDVGAIRRVRRGRTKVITVTPEGAFRGNVHEHAKTVERYRLDVIEGGRRDEDDPEG